MKKSVRSFLIINTLLFTCAGVLLGVLLNLFIDDRLLIFLCASYSAFFFGFLGGLLYLFRNNLA